jgi:geranylgeranyl diphosphate synthase type II
MGSNIEKESSCAMALVEQKLMMLGGDSISYEKSLNGVFQKHLATGGGRIRAKLTLEQGQLLGLPTDITIPLATAIEVLHQASLIHDDIVDGDESRRGQASVWFGESIATAICLGDALISESYRLITEIPELNHKQLQYLVQRFSDGICKMAAGQALDCAWSPGSKTSFMTYQEVVRNKSGPLIGFPIALPMALANVPSSRVDHVMDIAMNIGVAYQLADDFIDQEEDYMTRLNGFWILVEETASREEAEIKLRQKFNECVNQACEALEVIPKPCRNSIMGLISQLYQKHPIFLKAA